MKIERAASRFSRSSAIRATGADMITRRDGGRRVIRGDVETHEVIWQEKILKIPVSDPMRYGKVEEFAFLGYGCSACDDWVLEPTDSAMPAVWELYREFSSHLVNIHNGNAQLVRIVRGNVPKQVRRK